MHPINANVSSNNLIKVNPPAWLPALSRESIPKFRRHFLVAVALAVSAGTAQAAITGWNKTAGTNDYNSAANWVGGNPNGIFDSSLTFTGAQTVTFATDTVLTTGLSFNYAGNFSMALTSSGTAPHTLTLGGDIMVNPVSNQTVTIGSMTNVLNVDLGGTTRTFTVAANKTLTFLNAITNGSLILGGGGSIKLSGGGANAATSDVAVNNSTTLAFDSSTAGVGTTTRTKSVTLNSAMLTVTGNSTANSVDTITNALTIGPGGSTVTITPNAAKNAQLQAGSFVRNSGGVAFFRGTNLGVNGFGSGTNSSNIRFTAAPVLSGTGSFGTSTTGIIAGAYGDTTASGNGTGLVTYDATNGVRLLNTSTEYSSAITNGQTQLDNVRLVGVSGAPVTNTINSATTINSLSMNVSGSGTNSGVTINGSGTLKISSGMVFGNQTVTAATATDAMTITGVTLDFNGGEAFFLTGKTNGQSGNVTSAPLEIDSAITNTSKVVIGGYSNGGEVQIGGTTANSYTADTVVNGGTVRFNKTTGVNAIGGNLVVNAGTVLWGTSNEIPDAASITLNGGIIQLRPSTNTGSSSSETFNNLTVTGGSFSSGAASAGSNTCAINGNTTISGGAFTQNQDNKVTVGGTLSLSNGGTFTIANANHSNSTFETLLTLNGGLALANTATGAYTPISISPGTSGTNFGGKINLAGDLTFTGNGTNTNTTTIDAPAGASLGVIALSGTRIFAIGDGAATSDLTINAPLLDGNFAAGGLIKTGAGTLALTASSSYTGGTTINSGTLALSGGANRLATSGDITVTGGALDLGGNTQASSGVARFQGGTVQNGTLSKSGAAFDAQAGTVTAGLSGTSGLTKSTGGVFTLSGSNSYTGVTSINGGILALGNTGALNGGGNISFGGGTLQHTSSNTLDYSARIVGSAGAIQVDTNGQNVTYSSSLAGSNTGGLTKLGTGTLTLAGFNAYTGNTSINAGLLALTNSGALAGGGNISFGGGTLQYSAANTADYSARIIGSTGAIQVDTNSQSVTYASSLAGSNTGGLTKLGAGTLTLAGSNAYTGTTNLNAGILSLGNNGALGGGGNLNFGGGTLQYSGANTSDYSGRIVGSGAAITLDTNGQNVTYASSLAGSNTGGLTKLGVGTLTLSGSNAYAGATSLTGGILSLGSTGALAGGGNINFGGGTLQYTASNTADYSARIAGSGGAISVDTNAQSVTYATSLAASNTGGLVKSGAGTLTLSASNAYTGSTGINAGTLKFSGNSGSASSSDVTANSGAILSFDSSTSGVAGTTRAKSATLNAATLTVTGNSTANSVDAITNALTAGTGGSTVTLTPNAAKNTQLQSGSLVRNAGSTILFRGMNLGVNALGSGTNSTNINFTTGPALSGTGSFGTTTAGIIVGAYGDTIGNGAGSGLVTFDSTYGLRLLNTSTETKSSIADGQTQLDNVRLANSGGTRATYPLNSNTTVNSLSFSVTGTTTNSGITVNGSGTLKLNSGVVFGTQQIATSGTADAMIVSVPTLDLNGKEGVVLFNTLNAGSSGEGGGVLEIDSKITNDGGNGVTFNGSGVTRLAGSAANDYTGTTTVNAGNLWLTKTGTNAIPGNLVINGGNVIDPSNQIADTADITINGGMLAQKSSLNSGSGASETFRDLTMNGGSYSDGVGGTSSGVTNLRNANVTGGVWSVTAGHKTSLSGSLNLSNGGTIAVAKANDSSRPTILTVTGDLGITNTSTGVYTPVSLAGGNATGVAGGQLVLFGNVNFMGASTNSNTVTIDATAPTGGGGIGTVALNGARTFNIGDGASINDLTITAPIVDGTTTGSLVKNGVGTLALTATSTYSGGTAINAGTLKLNGGNNRLSTTGNLTVAGGTLDLGGNSQTTGGAVSFQGGTIQNGTLTKSGAAFDAQTGTVTAVLDGAVGLTKTTAGTLTLSGANTYTGATAINGGILALGSSGALGGGGNLTFGGGTLQYSASNTLDYSGRIVLSIGAITIDTNGQNVTYASALAASNSGGLVKLGLGALTLMAAEAYSGGTTIRAGTLFLMNTLAGTLTVNSGATLGGTGMETGLVTASGAGSTFTPADDNTIGTLDLNGGLNAPNGAIFDFNINGLAIDTIDFASGTLSLSGTVTVNFTNLGVADTGVPYSLFTGSGTWSGSPVFILNPPSGLYPDPNNGGGSGYVWNPAGHSFTVQFAGAPAWYLNASQPTTDDWNTLADWYSIATGGGSHPSSIKSTDDFDANNFTVHTPAISSGVATFPGHSLIISGNGGVLSVGSTGWAATIVPNLISTSGTLSAATSVTLGLNSYSNVSGTTWISPAANSVFNLNIGTLSGDGDLTMKSTGGTLALSATNASDYSGAIILTTGTLDFQNTLFSAGPLIVSGTNSQVVLDQSVSFGGLTISGSALASGTYSYATLHTSYPGVFSTGTSTATLTNRTPVTWYLSVNQPANHDWTTANVSDWKANANGTGGNPGAVNPFDNFDCNGHALRTPPGDSSFRGGNLIMGAGAILDLQTASGEITTIPGLTTTGGTITSLATDYVQNLSIHELASTSGTTIFSAAASQGISLTVDVLSGAGGLNLTGGGSFLLNFTGASGYTGTITLSNGTLDFELAPSGNPLSTSGTLVVNSGATVLLNEWAYFTGLTVGGVTKPAGTYSAATLGFSGTGTIVVYQADLTGPPQMFGVNIACGEFNSSIVPGTFNVNYTYPSDAEFAYYQGKGLNFIRVPFLWERVQHSLYATLDATEMGRLDAVVGYAHNRGMKVLLDMHDYNNYRISGTHQVGSPEVPYTAYQNVWGQLAAHYKNETAVYGYDIMNEPQGTLVNWQAAAQNAVNGIRQNDTTHYVFVEGISSSGAQSWLNANATLNIADPANRLVYSAHSYWDSNHSGTYTLTYDAQGAYPTIGNDFVAPFLQWLQARPGSHGHIGEYGVPNADAHNSSEWNVVLDNFLTDIQSAGLSGTYWAGGPWWGAYILSCEPTSNFTVDSAQMVILQKYH